MTNTADEKMAEAVRVFMLAMLHAAPQETMSRATATTLGVLHDAGPQRITTLAKYNAVSQPAMTALVCRLEEQGLVIRVSDPTDGRGRLVTITRAGISAITARRRGQRAAVMAEIEKLTVEQRDRLEAALPALEQMSNGRRLALQRLGDSTNRKASKNS